MFVAFACRHPAAARSNLMGGPRYSFSFVTKREAEKSRYFRGAGHGLRETARALRERRSAQFPLRIQERTDWPLPGANTLRLDGSQFLLFVAAFW